MQQVNKVLGGFLLGLTLAWPATAQDISSKRRSEPGARPHGSGTNDTLTQPQQTALYVLAQLSDTANTLDDEQFKIRVLAQAADILWRYDEPRARRQFEEAFRAISAVKPDKQNTAAAGLPFAPASPLAQLRGEVLSLVARHDADLAEKLISSTAEVKPNAEGEVSAPGDKNQGESAGLYLQTAASLADTNPERAVQLAAASLTGGLNPSILGVLFALRQQQPAQADALYKLTLAAARRDPDHVGVNLQILATYALPEFTAAGIGGGATQNSGGPARPDGGLAIELLNFANDSFLRLAEAAQTRPPNPIDYMTGQRLLPFFVRHLPDKAPVFRNSLDVIAQRATQGSAIEAVNKLYQPASTDDLVKQAEKTTDQFQRDLLYFRAALAAVSNGEVDRALTLAEKVNNSELHGGLDSLVRYQAASSLLDKGEVDAALRYAKGVSDLRQRAFLLAKVARALYNRKDLARAAEVLADAQQMLGKADEGLEKAQSLLIITEVETRLSPLQGFEVMEAAIRAFNNFDANPDDKSKPAPAGLAAMLTKVYKLETPDFGPSFSLLARTDFNRTIQLAQTLKKKDRAILAQLATCRGVLVKDSGRGT